MKIGMPFLGFGTPLLFDVCQENGIRVTPFCGGRVLRLSHVGTVVHLFGSDFGLNTASAYLIAKNKAACSAVLEEAGIPCVAHQLFYRPDCEDLGYSHVASWSDMLDYFYANGETVVCKPNDLFGGIGVHRVMSRAELETSVHEVFCLSREVCLSPSYRLMTSIERLCFAVLANCFT